MEGVWWVVKDWLGGPGLRQAGTFWWGEVPEREKWLRRGLELREVAG